MADARLASTSEGGGYAGEGPLMASLTARAVGHVSVSIAALTTAIKEMSLGAREAAIAIDGGAYGTPRLATAVGTAAICMGPRMRGVGRESPETMTSSVFLSCSCKERVNMNPIRQ